MRLKTQMYSLYRQLEEAPTDSPIRAILVKLCVFRPPSWRTTMVVHCTPLSAGYPAANQGDGTHVSEMTRTASTYRFEQILH
jgi:hypothetical protein